MVHLHLAAYSPYLCIAMNITQCHACPGWHKNTSVLDITQRDFVAFLLGCSLSFEALLTREGIRLAHVERGGIVPMYRTNIETVPAGPFGGNMVVSMRPMQPAEAIRAVEEQQIATVSG